jgi:hypothetical protein
MPSSFMSYFSFFAGFSFSVENESDLVRWWRTAWFSMKFDEISTDMDDLKG